METIDMPAPPPSHEPALLRWFFGRQRFLRNDVRTQTGARNLFRAEFAEQLGRVRVGRERVSVLDTFGDL